jgi:DNA-3-methyladenine glycosylase I
MEVLVGNAHPESRCVWAGGSQLYQDYHDQEWGVPLHNERALFEFLILEGAQAGLSWITILKKRDAYRAAFDNFDALRVASYDEQKIGSLIQNAGIVRNRLKIRSAVINAQKFLEVQNEFGSFDAFLWRFVDNTPQQNNWRTLADVPSSTLTSDAMSKELKRRGFKFVGSTICYALMQATGMVNDHTTDCYRHAQLKS